MRADFASLMLDVSNAMEKMKTATLKLAKRDTRALEAAFTEEEPVAGPVESSKWNRRAEILKRARKLPTREELNVSSDQASTG